MAHGGGSKNIKAINDSFEALKGLGLTPAQIVKIAAHGGGSNNIEAIKDAFKELQELGLYPEQIVKVVSHDGGSKNIKAIKDAFKELQELDLYPEQIVNIASHHGGSKNIEAILTYYSKLIKLGFSEAQIVKMVARDGGSFTLKLLATDTFLEEFRMLSSCPAGRRGQELRRLLAKQGISILDDASFDLSWLDTSAPTNGALDAGQEAIERAVWSSVEDARLFEGLATFLSGFDISTKHRESLTRQPRQGRKTRTSGVALSPAEKQARADVKAKQLRDLGLALQMCLDKKEARFTISFAEDLTLTPKEKAALVGIKLKKQRGKLTYNVTVEDVGSATQWLETQGFEVSSEASSIASSVPVSPSLQSDEVCMLDFMGDGSGFLCHLINYTEEASQTASTGAPILGKRTTPENDYVVPKPTPKKARINDPSKDAHRSSIYSNRITFFRKGNRSPQQEKSLDNCKRLSFC